MSNPLRIAGIILFVSLVAFLIKATDRPAYRYSKYPCQFDMIYGQKGPVDLVVIGSSRSLQGVDAEILSNELGGTTVYNLAKNWRGQGINYALLRDVISRREVDTILVEANLPEGGTYHAHFFVVGKISDWIKSYRFRSAGEFDFDILSVSSKKIIERITEQFSLILSGKMGDLAISDAPSPATTGYCRTREERIRRGYLDQQEARYHQYYVDQKWSWDLDSEAARHDFGFFKEMVDFASENNVKLYFYHINQAYYKTLDPEFSSVFQTKVGAQLFIPGEDLTREIENIDGYADTTHMTAIGREKYTHWLAQSLKSAR